MNRKVCVSVSINSIGQLDNYGGGFWISGGISEQTRRKLIALGIDPKTVKSEAEAMVLIKNAIKMRKSAKIPLPIEVCQGEQELISKAKTLAEKTGLIISETAPLEQILKKISDRIENGDYDEFKPELSLLQESSRNVKQNEDAIYASMNYNASLNKMILGL